MIAAIRVRGDVDVRQKASRTLDDLSLKTRNQCVVYEDNESVRGMLKVAKDYVAFGEISEETLEKLSDRKGKDLESGDKVKLSPPSGGFKDTKKQVGQGGTLGHREDMDQLVQKMV